MVSFWGTDKLSWRHQPLGIGYDVNSVIIHLTLMSEYLIKKKIYWPSSIIIFSGILHVRTLAGGLCWPLGIRPLGAFLFILGALQTLRETMLGLEPKLSSHISSHVFVCVCVYIQGRSKVGWKSTVVVGWDSGNATSFFNCFLINPSTSPLDTLFYLSQVCLHS